MSTRLIRHSSCLFVSLTLLAARAFPTPLEIDERSPARPLYFEANQGQMRDDVKFMSRGPGYGVYLTRSEAVLTLSRPASADSAHCQTNDADARVLRMGLIGGARTPAIHALDEQAGKANYFVGADSSQWRTNIPTYAKVRYDAVYPGIDVVYYGNQRQLEYDFVLAAGADPGQIELAFDGADRVEIAANGDLVLHACGREIRQAKPVVYQEADGRREVAGRYIRKGKNRIGFAVGAYDRNLPLTIDPLVLSYATYLGGNADEFAESVAVDTHGGAYLTGVTLASDFPVTSSAYQVSRSSTANAFVTKFDSTGSLVYSTYLGGTGNAHGEGIAVDQDGNAYVAGTTDGAFPTTPGAFQEMAEFGSDVNRSRTFVTKLDPTGSTLVYSTLLAGHVDGTVLAALPKTDIAVDQSGSAYVAGWARQTDFPTTPAAFQQSGGVIFVTKLNATGSALVYSAVFANTTDSSGTGSASHAITLDSEGNAYVTGGAWSRTFPVTTGTYQTAFGGGSDAFVTKLSPLGQLVFSTFLGGSGFDRGLGIALDPAGAIYVAGSTAASTANDFKITPRAYRTQPGSGSTGPGPSGSGGFVTKLNSSASELVYSTYVATDPIDIVVDAAGRAYVTLGEDRFVTIVEPSGSWADIWGVRRGPSGGLENASALGRNPAANAHLWVVGSTRFTDFPVTPNAFQPQKAPGANGDAFVMKFSPGPAPVPGTIEAENFDEGGEGPAYHENTPGTQGDAGFRIHEDVDIFLSNDAPGGSPYIVKNFESGEWLNYTINVPADGDYTLELHAATNFDFPNSSYYAEIDGANVTGVVVLPDTGGWDQYRWIGKRTITLTAGLHVLKIVSDAPYFGFDALRIDKATVTAPYYNAPAAIPGELEAEAFDAGGEGPGYHEHTPGNQGDAFFRTGEDVDIFVSNDYGSGSWYVVKNFETDEWLAYTIDVPAAGSYDIELRASTSPDFPNTAYYVVIDNQNVFFGTQPLPNTGGFDTYKWIGKKTVTLPAGVHVMKIVSAGQYFNLNTIRVTPTAAPNSRAYYGAPMAVPGVLEAEAFDKGGEGVGFHDNTSGNQGNSGVRYTESVDIFVTNDGASGSPYIVKNFEAGEWLNYTINVPATDNYDVELRAATNFDFPNSAYHLEVDGVNQTGSVVLPDTGSWDNYQWVGKRTLRLTEGAHVLTVVVDRPYFGFNSLRVLRSAP